MKLSQLTGCECIPDPKILGLTADSRAVKPGYIFAALVGTAKDGRQFIPQALENGAAAILCNHPVGFPISSVVPVVTDPEPRLRLAKMAARFYEHTPSFMVGITGTNGKTSTAQFCQQLWQRLGRQGGSLGTLGVHGISSEGKPWMLPLHHTTPDPVTLHGALAQANARGCTHMAMEVSSHALAQFRVDGVRFDVAAFTNLTQDHLDYHDSFDTYYQAKKRLFTDLLAPGATIIVNSDGAGSERLQNDLKDCGHTILRTGTAGADYVLEGATPKPDGLQVQISISHGEKFDVLLPLLGLFQAENALLAAAIVTASGIDAGTVFSVLADLKGVPGRMAFAGSQKGAGIYVDYAHTPDAVATVLKAARPHADGRLIAIIGAGGDRDRTKRPLMGKAAGDHADMVILADDNPRSEDPAAIRADILAAVPDAINIGDRAKAIEYAIDQLNTGDVLMVLGKGHETGQTIGDLVLPFDDTVEIQKLVGP